MSWSTEMVLVLRYMIGDLGTGSPAGEPPTFIYDDSRLQGLLLVAAQLAQTEMAFPVAYTVNVSQLILTPDPTSTAVYPSSSRDDGFINLVCLKAACIIDNSEARAAAGKGVKMRDDKKEIDTRNISADKIAILKVGWCKNYETAKYAYLSGNVQVGTAILGPFRQFSNSQSGPWTPDGGGDLFNDGRYR